MGAEIGWLPDGREVTQKAASAELGIDRQITGEITDPLPRLEPLRTAVKIENPGRSGGRPQEIEKQADCSGLACPVGAEEPEDLAFGYLQ